jgi:hypothetical protein
MKNNTKKKGLIILIMIQPRFVLIPRFKFENTTTGTD